MIQRINKHYRNKSGLWIALIILFVTFTKAQTSYPITDPRNPHCPCHKYQKLAEEEFKNLLATNNAVNTNENKPVELVSNKHVGISSDDKAKLNKHVGISEDAQKKQIQIINDDKHVGISDDEIKKNKEVVSFNDNPMGKINEPEGEFLVSEQKMSRSGSVSRSPQYTTTKHWKGKRKKHTGFYKQMKRIFYVGSWDIWKGKRVTSACYHWK